ncbi:hypothetical protein AKJ09_01953 [Labilithrix luteola]|uniref:Secreted protein n=1 Tax=Labilithrix luteola TaxID=1391654 RepID=A0A0K1PQ99_9BACT|nr:hypothetical protein [Labilithrix luteola]AKU95289.1 hypothetical protein AKJ09_01953 [Labilithrix luteola]
MRRSGVVVGAIFTCLACIACIACSRPTSSGELDATGCLADPPPAGPEERGPFPFEACRPTLNELRPVRALDQEATVKRRARDPRACCYEAQGNR